MTREWSPGTFLHDSRQDFLTRLTDRLFCDRWLKNSLWIIMHHWMSWRFHDTLPCSSCYWWPWWWYWIAFYAIFLTLCLSLWFFAEETPLTVFVFVIHPLLLFFLLLLLRRRFSHQMIFSQTLSSHHHQEYDAHSVSRWSIDYSSYLSRQNFPWPVSSLFLSFVSHDIFSRITMTKHYKRRKSEWSKKWKK